MLRTEAKLLLPHWRMYTTIAVFHAASPKRGRLHVDPAPNKSHRWLQRLLRHVLVEILRGKWLESGAPEQQDQLMSRAALTYLSSQLVLLAQLLVDPCAFRFEVEEGAALIGGVLGSS